LTTSQNGIWHIWRTADKRHNEILLAANIFFAVYIKFNIRTPYQKYLANQVDWWISWISNFWCYAVAITFGHKAGYIYSCCHAICPK